MKKILSFLIASLIIMGGQFLSPKIAHAGGSEDLVYGTASWNTVANGKIVYGSFYAYLENFIWNGKQVPPQENGLFVANIHEDMKCSQELSDSLTIVDSNHATFVSSHCVDSVDVNGKLVQTAGSGTFDFSDSIDPKTKTRTKSITAQFKNSKTGATTSYTLTRVNLIISHQVF